MTNNLRDYHSFFKLHFRSYTHYTNTIKIFKILKCYDLIEIFSTRIFQLVYYLFIYLYFNITLTSCVVYVKLLKTFVQKWFYIFLTMFVDRQLT